MPHERLVKRAEMLQARSTDSPMASSVTIAPRTGLDSSGEPLFGPGVVYPCVVNFKAKRVTTAEGEEVTVQGEAPLGPTDPEVTTQDHLTLPDDETPRIVNVEKHWVGGTLVTQKVQF